MKVLIADDDAVSRRILHAMLTALGHDVVMAANGQSAIEALQADDKPRLAILDWCMPGIDGLEVCRRVREAPSDEYTYVVMLTKRRRRSDLELGIAAGVDDYLTKPLNAGQLRLCVQTGERITRIQHEMLTRAATDALTGLANRPTVRARLGAELARCERHGRPVGVLAVDIDHFKQVNDTHGHPVGDEVLREVARRMSAAVRPYDTVGRHGGEEFLIVLPGCRAADAHAAAEHVRESVVAEPVATTAGPVRVSVSVGATSNDGDAGLELEALVEASDAALYQAKREGRDRVSTRPVVLDTAIVTQD